MREAKAKLSALVQAAERGESTILTKHGKPAAKLVPIEDDRHDRKRKRKQSLVEYLRTMPVDIPLERDRTPLREIEF
ncbi:MAG: type II toxin-antitoxin system Phd/YefM family antitoxin [Propylenella sp.]